jgi:putative hydrolase of HD superfamily
LLKGGKKVIRKALLLKMFSAAFLQRWNDKIRPVEFTELDKQAHKMIIAYFLGKFEERDPGFDWIQVIEGGIFEFLQRIVLTDLKPPVFYRIKENPDKYRQLNDWVYLQLNPVLTALGPDFNLRFRRYFTADENTLNRRLLSAAHFYATKWEFDILERVDPHAYEMDAIRRRLEEVQSRYEDLEGVRRLKETPSYKSFMDLCGQLRFQLRWANIHRVPRTSVLGHSLFVAILSYILSMTIDASPKRRSNNFFTGLFHDLPEVLTRDIISPVKRSIEGLEELIKEYEREMMEKEVYNLIPAPWHDEIRMFTESEFVNVVLVDGQRKEVTSREISDRFNSDGYSPRDGELVKAADRLAAFVEAYVAIRNGSASPELQEAIWYMKNNFSRIPAAGINFQEIYADFE